MRRTSSLDEQFDGAARIVVRRAGIPGVVDATEFDVCPQGIRLVDPKVGDELFLPWRSVDWVQVVERTEPEESPF